jgi:hypothetical protein
MNSDEIGQHFDEARSAFSTMSVHRLPNGRQAATFAQLHNQELHEWTGVK